MYVSKGFKCFMTLCNHLNIEANHGKADDDNLLNTYFQKLKIFKVYYKIFEGLICISMV